jgi:hypothetical protein
VALQGRGRPPENAEKRWDFIPLQKAVNRRRHVVIQKKAVAAAKLRPAYIGPGGSMGFAAIASARPTLALTAWPLAIFANAAAGAGSSRQSLPNLQVVIQ